MIKISKTLLGYKVYSDINVTIISLKNNKEIVSDYTIEVPDRNDYQETVNSINTFLAKNKYDKLVKQKIRNKYSIDDELAILRQKDTKPLEFKAYNDYCELCKLNAKNELG